MSRENAKRVALMKVEILNCIIVGQIPNEISSFSELHDFVDANEFGNVQADDPEQEQILLAECQQEVDEWIASGGLKAMLEQLGYNGSGRKTIEKAKAVAQQSVCILYQSGMGSTETDAAAEWNTIEQLAGELKYEVIEAVRKPAGSEVFQSTSIIQPFIDKLAAIKRKSGGRGKVALIVSSFLSIASYPQGRIFLYESLRDAGIELYVGDKWKLTNKSQWDWLISSEQALVSKHRLGESAPRGRILNLGQLRSIFSEYPDNTLIIASKDEEGNGFGFLSAYEQVRVELIGNQMKLLEPLEGKEKGFGVKALLFWPVSYWPYDEV